MSETLESVTDTLQTWIATADDEYDREEQGRVTGLKEALHEIKKIQTCEDAISREDALKAIEEQKKGFYGVERYAIDECYSAVMNLPSVHPQPKGLKDMKLEIDHISEMHSDGEIYIKNIDVKRIITKYLLDAYMRGED